MELLLKSPIRRTPSREQAKSSSPNTLQQLVLVFKAEKIQIMAKANIRFL